MNEMDLELLRTVNDQLREAFDGNQDYEMLPDLIEGVNDLIIKIEDLIERQAEIRRESRLAAIPKFKHNS